MARKILVGLLIGVSSILLTGSMVGIILGWALNQPLTDEALARLDEIDAELAQAEVTLRDSKTELERTLRIVDETEAALNQFTQNDPQAFFADVQTTLDDELLPELETARERLISARDTLENIRVTLFGLNLVPFLQINIPDKVLTDLIDSAEALESRIGDVSQLAGRASTLLDDAAYLLGGDFSETRSSLEFFLKEIDVYQEKVTGWRGQVADLKESLPRWIDSASLLLTVVLLWFGFSQLGLILHGLNAWRENDPLAAVREMFRKQDQTKTSE
ncbi:MAG: hypothetical protein DPW18_15620 [Chloroflexi bacterium]|nr:MAG: hypothetical protein EDM79_17060 [Chloroflexota bacterium]MCQ3938457.1 hypothetical protein [Chloroflexota bacterium]MDL1944039.1 hypothetical protein [Chloroflexi bacterium CFX2]